MQVTGVRVEDFRLLANRIHNVWMAMAYRRDVVVRVEITLAVRVVKPDTFTPDDMQWALIEESIGRSECLVPTLDQ
ncbi:hypothetical protein D3C84_733770 [compost metagenome]